MFVQGLNDVQREKAILNFSKAGNNNLTEAFTRIILNDLLVVVTGAAR